MHRLVGVCRPTHVHLPLVWRAPAAVRWPLLPPEQTAWRMASSLGFNPLIFQLSHSAALISRPLLHPPTNLLFLFSYLFRVYTINRYISEQQYCRRVCFTFRFPCYFTEVCVCVYVFFFVGGICPVLNLYHVIMDTGHGSRVRYLDAHLAYPVYPRYHTLY